MKSCNLLKGKISKRITHFDRTKMHSQIITIISIKRELHNLVKFLGRVKENTCTTSLQASEKAKLIAQDQNGIGHETKRTYHKGVYEFQFKRKLNLSSSLSKCEESKQTKLHHLRHEKSIKSKKHQVNIQNYTFPRFKKQNTFSETRRSIPSNKTMVLMRIYINNAVFSHFPALLYSLTPKPRES